MPIVVIAVIIPIALTLVPAVHTRIFAGHRRLGTFAVLCAVTIVGQLALIVVTRFVLDRTTMVAPRYLIGAQVLCYILIVTLATAAVRNVRTAHGPIGFRRGTVPASVAAAVWLAMVSTISPGRIPWGSDTMGRTSQQLFEPPALSVDPAVQVVTNNPEALWSATGAPTLLLPKPTSATSGVTNRAFDRQIDAVAALADRRPVAVVTLPVRIVEGLDGEEAVARLQETHGFVVAEKCRHRVRIWARRGDADEIARRVQCR